MNSSFYLRWSYTYKKLTICMTKTIHYIIKKIKNELKALKCVLYILYILTYVCDNLLYPRKCETKKKKI